jgi:hypothetical protein
VWGARGVGEDIGFRERNPLPWKFKESHGID